MRLGQRYGGDRLEAASIRALAAEALSYRSLESILRTGLDRQPPAEAPTQLLLIHDNVRGGDYYK